ncbi:MAG: hypothetical protein IPK82_29265 [Polyangiaceae bacterium]|nr:hypothetical protein [Polyangiaceae bacterium]
MDERTMRRWWTSGLASALIVLFTGRATAQGSPAAPTTGPTPPMLEKTDPAASPPSEAPLRMLAVTVGGGLAHASDDRESSAQRGSVNVDVALRLGGALRGLEIQAGYDNLLGNWEYIQKNPSLDGSGPQRAEAFEQRHRIALDVRYDVLRLIKKGLPIHLSPMLGLAFVRVDSSLFGSQMFGGGGGATVVAELDPRTAVDASFSVLRGFTGEGGEATLFGSITGLWNWGAGASIGATDWSRVRLGYVGEALDRQATTRFAHGVRLSLTVSFL